MSDFYDEAFEAAVELLDELGAPITLTRTTPGAYDTDLGTNGPGTVQTFTAAGVAIDYAQGDIDGSRIKYGDRRVYLAPDLGTTPVTGDKMTLADGVVVTVVVSKPLAPAGQVVLHDCQVRS